MKKFNNKGLTLVELMAVISVLAVVALIVTPNILGSLRKSRERLYNTQIDNIVSAAKNWAADEIEKKHCLICVPDSDSTKTYYECLKNGGEGCKEVSNEQELAVSVYLGQLQDNGYITDDLSNPKTDEPFNRCVKVDITKDKETGEFVYDVPNPDLTGECSDGDFLLLKVEKPTYSISPESGWATSKTLTINYASNYHKNEYSTDGGTTWKTYTGPIKFTSNATVTAKATFGTDEVEVSDIKVTQIDASAPTASSFTYTQGTNSVKITASGTDSQSGIKAYSFAFAPVTTYTSSSTGTTSTVVGTYTWTTQQTSSVYTFSGLTSGSKYNFKVRVYNGTGSYKESSVQSVTIN